jgi:glucokinase
VKPVGVLDIGGSKILAGLLSPAGHVLGTRRAPIADRRPRCVAGQAADLLRDLLGARRSALRGVGCSIPGPLDRKTGRVLLSPNLEWRNVPFGCLLSEALHLPVAMDDDARCAAIGEWWRGAGRQARCLLYIVVGTGVGGGLVIDGRPVYGADDAAGEIGHTIVAPSGPRCSCGQRGCLEAVASGPAIERAAWAATTPGRASFTVTGAGAKLLRITAEQVVKAARRGDPTTGRILDRAGAYLGRAIANAVTLLNPDRVILGGSVARAAAWLWLPRLRQSVRELSLATAASTVRIGLGSLGETAGLVGACWTFMRMEDNSASRMG